MIDYRRRAERITQRAEEIDGMGMIEKISAVKMLYADSQILMQGMVDHIEHLSDQIARLEARNGTA